MLAELLKRPEVARTGVYFLVGPDPDNPARSLVYVGESDDVSTRLKQHNRGENQGGKDFWEKVCVVTSKDSNLTKAHAKYLESVLIGLAREAARSSLVNGNAPVYGAQLPEADIADMAFFLEQVRTVLPVLGFDFLRSRPNVSFAPGTVGSSGGQRVSPIFELSIRKHGVSARAREIDGDFIVLKGAAARAQWTSEHPGYRALYDQLVDDGILSEQMAGVRTFTADYAFSSPSAAAAVISGRPANGRTAWINADTGESYANWQEHIVSQI